MVTPQASRRRPEEPDDAAARTDRAPRDDRDLPAQAVVIYATYGYRHSKLGQGRVVRTDDG